MDRPDILFLVLDSMRKDRVSSYGHSRETTPALDELTSTATLYENAYTPTPWTLPSHCSMFTGLMPSEHGITNGFKGSDLRLSSDLPTLTERLSEFGYRTAGFSNNPWVGALSGLDRGFEEYVEWDLRITSRDGTAIHRRLDELCSRAHWLVGHAARRPAFLLKRPFFTANLVDRAKRWLDATADNDTPTFTFLNLMEAHSPYFPPDDAFAALGLDTPGPIEPRVLNTKLLAYVFGSIELSPDQRERVMKYYDACLRYQDRKVAELLRTLKDHGTFDDTLIVVCSDHGKTLGDVSRNSTPPHYVYEHNTDVPLFVKRPGQLAEERVTDPAELTRLFEVFVDSPTRPEAALSRDDYGLVEDFIPHTGNEEQDSDRWHVLCEPDRRYVRNDAGDEYLLENGSVTADPSGAVAGRLRDGLESRLAKLSPDQATAEASDELSSSVEAQLGDLGYLK